MSHTTNRINLNQNESNNINLNNNKNNNNNGSFKNDTSIITQRAANNTLGQESSLPIACNLSLKNVTNEHSNHQKELYLTGQGSGSQIQVDTSKQTPNSTTRSLSDEKKEILNNILDKTYVIPGKNSTSPLIVNLRKLLAELYVHAPEIKISLIGSTIGYILNDGKKEYAYNDIDFLIEVNLAIENNLGDEKVEEAVKNCANKMRDIIEDIIAKSSSKKYDREEIGLNYFDGQILINKPINWEDPASSDNRCSIIRFGELEFKTVINIVVKQNSNKTIIIPGLKNPYAFRSDGLRIPLAKEFLNPGSEALSTPLQIISVAGDIEQVKTDITKKELYTDTCEGNKYLKGIEKITTGCVYQKPETERSIYELFCASKDAIGWIEKYCKKHQAENPLKTICVIFNFLTQSANFGKPYDCTEKDYACIRALLLAYFPQTKDQNMSQELLLKWCYLVFVLSSKVTSPIDQSTYCLVKPKDPLKVLFDCVVLLEKHPGLSIENLPVLKTPFKSIEELFLKIKPLLDDEQLIRFDHFLVLHYPLLLEGGFGMLQLLAKVLSGASAEKRQELVQLTQESFKIRGINTPNLFQSLKASALPISTLFLLCIQELSFSDLAQAQAMWDYANKQSIFAGATEEEMEAFVCIHKAQLAKNPSKEELSSLLKSIREFSVSKEPCDSMKELLSKIQPLLEPEQLIMFNHFLASYDPSLLKEEFGMLQLLAKVLPGASVQKRQELIQLTQDFFKIKGINTPKLFKSLSTSTENLSTSTVFLMCIQELSPCDLAKAKAVWNYAKEQSIFTGAAVEEMEAFAYVQMAQLEKNPSEGDGLTSLLKEVTALLKQHSTLFVENSSASKTPCKNMKRLVLKIESLLDDEERIIFNHFLLFNFPSLLNQGNSLEFKILHLLLSAVSKNPSSLRRKELAQLTQEVLEKKEIGSLEFLKNLPSSAETLPISSLVLLCIQGLSLRNLAKAQAFWEYAKKQDVFMNSIVDEMGAFVSVRGAQLEENPSKDKLIGFLKETTSLLSRLPKTLTSEEIKRLDFFHGSLLSLIDKLNQIELTPNELHLILSLYGEIKRSNLSSAEIKTNLRQLILNSSIKLNKTKQSSNSTQKNESIISALKELLSPPSDESTKNIIHQVYLQISPNEPTIANGLFSIPGFIPALVEQMKESSLEKNIPWFTALHREKFTNYEDEATWKCCEILLAQWKENPNPALYRPILKALHLLKESLERSKKISVTQKESSKKKESNQVLEEKTISAHTNFIHGCIKSKNTALFNEAETILCNGIRFLFPSINASLFSDLICNCTDIEKSIKHFNIAVNQKILSEVYPELLFTICNTLLNTSVQKKAKEMLAELILNNNQLVTCLTSRKNTDISKLILKILNVQMKSPSVVNNQICLLQQIYKHRKESADASIDSSIYGCTHLFMTSPTTTHFSADQWLLLVDMLINNMTIFSEDDKRQGMKNLISSALYKGSSSILEFVKKNSNKEANKCKSLLNTLENKLNECAKIESRPLKPDDCTNILINYMQCLIHQKNPKDALTILEGKIKDPTALIYATNQIFISLSSTKQIAILYSDVSTQLITNILNIYSNYALNTDLEGKKSMQFYRANVFTLLHCAIDKTINKDMKQLLNTHLRTLINFIKSHPKLLEQTNYDIKKCCTELLLILSQSRHFHEFTKDFLNYAIEQKFIDPKGDQCVKIRAYLQETLLNLK